jgi:hypothetical protein
MAATRCFNLTRSQNCDKVKSYLAGRNFEAGVLSTGGALSVFADFVMKSDGTSIKPFLIAHAKVGFSALQIHLWGRSYNQTLQRNPDLNRPLSRRIFLTADLQCIQIITIHEGRREYI